MKVNVPQEGQPSDTPVVIPLHRYRHEPIPDDSFPIKSVTFTNEPIESKTDSEALHMVVGHGAWGGPHTMGPLVRYALGVAATEGRRARVTLYSDPWLGFRGYAAADRAERFDKVIRVTNRCIGEPVHMVAHSWSGAESLEVAGRAQHEEVVSSYIAYTLANRIEEGGMGFGSFLARGFREFKQGNAMAGWRSLGTIGVAGVGALMHGIALPTAIDECSKAFNTRLTPQLVELSKVMRVGVALAGCDAFFGPADVAKAQLQERGFNETNGAIEIMHGATHMGAVSNFRFGRNLYELVADVASRPSIVSEKRL